MFHQDFQNSKTTKTLGLRPRAFISFLVFGNPDETLALSYEILHLYRVEIALFALGLDHVKPYKAVTKSAISR